VAGAQFMMNAMQVRSWRITYLVGAHDCRGDVGEAVEVVIVAFCGLGKFRRLDHGINRLLRREYRVDL
jgi:hypothetical protein